MWENSPPCRKIPRHQTILTVNTCNLPVDEYLNGKFSTLDWKLESATSRC